METSFSDVLCTQRYETTQKEQLNAVNSNSTTKTGNTQSFVKSST